MTTPLIYLAFGFVDVQPTIIGLIVISGYIMTPFHVVSVRYISTVGVGCSKNCGR